MSTSAAAVPTAQHTHDEIELSVKQENGTTANNYLGKGTKFFFNYHLELCIWYDLFCVQLIKLI